MTTHNDIDSKIKFLAKSEIRLKILSELNKKPNNVRGLVKKTHITYSSVSSNLIKLEKNNFIKKVKKNYCITPMAEIYFNTLMEFKSSVDLISDYDSFWDKHNLKQLSIESIKSMTDLKDSQLIETTPIDIYKTHTVTKKQLVKSKNVKAIFPYMHPEYPKIIEKILQNEGYVELIMPEIISKEIMSRVDNKIKNSSIKKEQMKVYSAKNDLNLYLTICDETMSLGLFKTDGSFDQNRILTSDNKISQNWANDLFEHVKYQVIQ